MGTVCLNIAQAAEELGISVGTLRNLMKNDGLPYFHASPRRVLIPTEGLKKWMDKKTINPITDETPEEKKSKRAKAK